MSTRQTSQDVVIDARALASHLGAHLTGAAAMARLAGRLSAAAVAPDVQLAMRDVLPVLHDERTMLCALVAALDPDGTAPLDHRHETMVVLAAAPPWDDALVATALDELLASCWCRLALWRALADRCRSDERLVRPSFEGLARRSARVIGELERLRTRASTCS